MIDLINYHYVPKQIPSDDPHFLYNNAVSNKRSIGNIEIAKMVYDSPD